MSDNSCAKCGRCEPAHTELNVKDNLKGVMLIYGLPLLCFLVGAGIGFTAFRRAEGKPFYGILLGFLFMFAAYRIFPKKRDKL